MPAVKQMLYSSTEVMTPVDAEDIVEEPVDAQEMDTVYLTDNEMRKVGRNKRYNILRRKVYQLRRMLRVKQGTIRHLRQQVANYRNKLAV